MIAEAPARRKEESSGRWEIGHCGITQVGMFAYQTASIVFVSGDMHDTGSLGVWLSWGTVAIFNGFLLFVLYIAGFLIRCRSLAVCA